MGFVPAIQLKKSALTTRSTSVASTIILALAWTLGARTPGYVRQPGPSARVLRHARPGIPSGLQKARTNRSVELFVMRAIPSANQEISSMMSVKQAPIQFHLSQAPQ